MQWDRRGQAAPQSLVTGVQAEASRVAGGTKQVGLVHGPADKGVVLHAQPLATQADKSTGQLARDQPFGRWPRYLAVVETGIDLLAAGAQGHANFIAQQPATLGRQ